MEEGAEREEFWRLYSCSTSLRKGRKSLCNRLCFLTSWQRVFLHYSWQHFLSFLKNKLIALPIPACRALGEDLLPTHDLNRHFVNPAAQPLTAKKQGGQTEGENYGGTYYNKSTTCWLFVQAEGERKRGGGVKGGSRGPQLMEGVICES